MRLLKVEQLEGDPWQLQDIDLKQGALHCLLGMYDLESTKQAHSLTCVIIKQQQHKLHGKVIQLVQAKNAVEQSSKGKASSVWFRHASALIHVTLGS